MRYRHILWNLAGLGFPLLVAIIAVPPLLKLLGQERFGLLALAWGLIGYAGALDLGIGRATTHAVASLRDSPEEGEIPDVVATAVRLTVMTGMAAMGLIALGAFMGAASIIKSVGVSERELELSLLLLALALPMQAISATYRGVNEAYLNFTGINVLRIVLGAANFGAPLAVAFWTVELQWLVCTLVLSRGLALIVYRYQAQQCLRQGDHGSGGYLPVMARRLLRFGAGFTVTSIVGPLMVQSDRFVVGIMIGAAAVTTYVIPYEVAVQSLIVVGAVTSVIFPVVCRLLQSDPQAAAALFRLWLIRVTIAMAVGMTLLATTLPALLELWLGAEASPDSVMIGRILCVGVVFNAAGSMYFSLLHARGHTRATALLHLTELPFYLLLLFILTTAFGVVGCATAWAVRTIIDAIALVAISRRAPRPS